MATSMEAYGNLFASVEKQSKAAQDGLTVMKNIMEKHGSDLVKVKADKEDTKKCIQEWKKVQDMVVLFKRLGDGVSFQGTEKQIEWLSK
eukprot:CAMPEP_0170518460 /NCGR_PEP_ID=MMETSP0209-20121228/4148_1 /TAXON_ID=665100 ORGANISM="Litonotus pictus, Strain P1" /NCGR_SAMPLE_ID=MMETSP0209 /ASSEMBLY_ACC=CAM_ASM_000301 /LENGTH=88 /DNA_ID=CAMNT_0010804027 /DNA_START=13 /DNA_END=279 /DNA_ORIENTATION=-